MAGKNDEELTSISLPVGVKNELEKLKIHPNQPYSEVIVNLLREHEERGGKFANKG
jgi:hypothetical protein